MASVIVCSLTDSDTSASVSSLLVLVVVVAGGGDDDDACGLGGLNGGLDDLVLFGGGAAEIDDVGAVLDGVIDAGGDGVGGADAIAVKDADGEE